MTKSQDNTYSVKVTAQPVGFFETPVAYGKLDSAESLLKDLEKVVRSNMAESGGLSRSNAGGWHSDTDMMQWGGGAADKLALTAISVAKRMSHFKDATVDDYDWFVRMWANVTSQGGFNHLHAHPGNLWAAVLYVDMGDDDENGEDIGGSFYIEDPRFPMAAMHNTGFRLIDSNGQPQQYELDFNLERGNLIVFPAWLRHGVRPYSGSEQRISIAMNIDTRMKAGSSGHPM